jgi:hypothetical protein
LHDGTGPPPGHSLFGKTSKSNIPSDHPSWRHFEEKHGRHVPDRWKPPLASASAKLTGHPGVKPGADPDHIILGIPPSNSEDEDVTKYSRPADPDWDEQVAEHVAQMNASGSNQS